MGEFILNSAHLISLGNTLPFISATSQISGKECSNEFPPLLIVCVSEAQESSDLDSLPGRQLACVALSSFLLPPPLSLSPVTSSCLSLAYIRAILYKLFTWKHCASRGKQ